MNALLPTEYFNALSDEDKKRVLLSGLGAEILQLGLEFAVPLWWGFEASDGTYGLRNGSAFLVDHGHGIFAVTAAHVLREYWEARSTARNIECQLGSALIDPESALIGCRDDLDIATFRVSEATAKQIDKRILKPDPPNWAPLSPAVRNFAFFAGFPAQTRGVTPTAQFFATAPYFAMPPITSITDHQIVCRFDRDTMIDLGANGLPPPGYDIGGVSGGPMLMPVLTGQGVVWRFAGVIIEAAVGDLFEGVVAVRADYIHPDGRLA